MARKTVDEMKEELTADTPRIEPLKEEDLLSTGLTVLNLALSGYAGGGIPKGKYVYFVGDSSSGKTWMALQIMAEACRNPRFDDYRLVYDAPEDGALMDIGKFYGRRMADRLDYRPAGHEKCSTTVKEMYYNLDAELDRGPVIWIEDSMDALWSDEDEESFEEERELYEQGKDTDAAKGTFGVAKAKTNSRHINRVVRRLNENGSILVIISQTRDKIGGTIPGQKTRAGGRALKFYSHVELWTMVKGDIKRTVECKERVVGSSIQIDVQKNRISGWDGKILVPFHRTHGMDETGACVDYLVEELWGKDKKGNIKAPEFQIEGTREKLIQAIERDDAERELQVLVRKTWKGIEEACAVRRKPRYE